MKATVEIRKGTLKDIPEISILWRDCFSENCAYLEHVFSTIYNDATVFVLLENNKIAASLFLFDIKLIDQPSQVSKKGRYLYGVCTINK